LEKKYRILIVDDEESIRFTLECFLTEEGYDDIILGGGKTGIDVIREARDRGVTCPVVVITGAPSVETAVEAARLGVFDYVPKPIRWENLLLTTKAALEGKDPYGKEG
jgi:DNA-binding NtrC family response regulator